MTINQMQPYVRYCRREKRYQPDLTLVAPDHRLFFCLEGETRFTIGDKEYHLEENGLLFWHAGIPYAWHAQSGDAPLLLGFNFDLTQAARMHTMPIPPEETAVTALEDACFSDYPELNGVIHLPNMHALRRQLLEIERECALRRLFWAERAGAMLSELLLLILRELHAPVLSRGGKTEQVLDFIHRNYQRALTNEQIGEELCYHPNYINRLIVKATGSSLHRYLLDFRIRAAISLLETTDLPIAAVGESVGFSDPSHFSRCFRQATGRSPSEYRFK